VSAPVVVTLGIAALAAVAAAVATYYAAQARASAQRAKASLRPCPLCNRPILPGEDQSSGTHHYCLWATSVGHEYGLCGCTGWNDPYLAGIEGERRAREGRK